MPVSTITTVILLLANIGRARGQSSEPRGYLLSPRLDVRRSGKLGDLRVRWPSQLVDRPKPRSDQKRYCRRISV
jgi:hypothetical protein